MRYSQGFIALQLSFAQRLAALMDATVGPVLAEHTVLRHLLHVSITREEQSDPVWQTFVDGVSRRMAAGAGDLSEWAYGYVQTHPAPPDEIDHPRWKDVCAVSLWRFCGLSVRSRFAIAFSTSAS